MVPSQFVPTLNSFSRRFVLFTLILAVFSFAIPVQAKSSKSGSGKGKSGKLSRTAKREIQVIKRLINQHQAAITLTVIGDEKCTNTQVKNYMKSYADRQQKELSQLKAWLKKWYKLTYNPPAQGDLPEPDEIELLDPSNDDFYGTLLDKLSEVHQRGLTCSKAGEDRAFHKELRKLAKSVGKSCRKDLLQLEDWSDDHYSSDDDSDDGPNHDVGDDHGRGRGQDDGPNHDVGDDHGRGRGQDDGPNHDVGDDHGRNRGGRG